MSRFELNRNACRLIDETLPHASRLGIQCREIDGGGRVIDCGISARGGLEAGRFLARLTLSDLAQVSIGTGEVGDRPCAHVTVSTDHPVAACMASQYAGWRIAVDDFFAMGSGPFRALHGGEELFDDIGCREISDTAVGILETRDQPDEKIFAFLSKKLSLPPNRITLAVAPTASLAGGLQIVARSVETALHKLHLLGFALDQVISGIGSAPLPPVAKDDLAALGRTNDAILYGARVELWVRGDDETIRDIGRRLPSSDSSDYGRPFAETFESHDYDFYKIDPHLFSPAEICIHNLTSGESQHFGGRNIDVLQQSFYAS